MKLQNWRFFYTAIMLHTLLPQVYNYILPSLLKKPTKVSPGRHSLTNAAVHDDGDIKHLSMSFQLSVCSDRVMSDLDVLYIQTHLEQQIKQ